MRHSCRDQRLLLALASMVFAFAQPCLGEEAKSKTEAKPPEPTSAFLEAHPQLKGLLFRDPVSPILVGFGASPLSFFPNRMAVSASVAQIHWLTSYLDWELLNATIGLSLGSGERSTRQFAVRTAPKFRVFDHLSLGVLGGYEYVTFPEVQSQIALGNKATHPGPFSTGGWIYGVLAAETFPWGASRYFRVTEAIYQQSYGIIPSTADQWGDRFLDPQIEGDPDKEVLKAGTVFAIEFSVLF
jgi:hypothetical protein